MLNEFYERLRPVLDSLDMKSELLIINDGSTDDTLKVIESLRSQDRRIGVIDLSRNFGKEVALTAGLDHADGDAVVVIDADLQDPPELIPELIKCWREGYDVVYATRTQRSGDTAFKKLSAGFYYKLLNRMSSINIPENTGDFRLLSQRAVKALRQCGETHRYMKGLFAWIGYPQKAVNYERDPRHAGVTKWNYASLSHHAMQGITAFSSVPLRFVTWLGLFVATLSGAYGIFMFIRTIIWGNPVAGYPSLLVIMLFLGGIQLLALGLIGEYLGRMFDETKNRPLYLVSKYEKPG